MIIYKYEIGISIALGRNEFMEGRRRNRKLFPLFSGLHKRIRNVKEINLRKKDEVTQMTIPGRTTDVGKLQNKATWREIRDLRIRYY